MKAALFSALLFPGSGHFLLRKRVRGALLAGVSLVCLYLLVATAVEIARQISDEILSGRIPLDPAGIADEVSKRSVAAGTLRTGISTYLLLACWLIGIVDAWRVGRLLEKSGPSRNGAEQNR